MYVHPIAAVLSPVITIFMAIPLHKNLTEMQKQIVTISTNHNN